MRRDVQQVTVLKKVIGCAVAELMRLGGEIVKVGNALGRRFTVMTADTVPVVDRLA